MGVTRARLLALQKRSAPVTLFCVLHILFAYILCITDMLGN
jgi:hypothetical protein